MSRRGGKKGDDGPRRGLPGLLRDLAFAALIVGAVFAAIFTYTRVYPPLVVIESESMQHADDTSYLGVIDTGDLVFVQAAPARRDVVTWIEGRVSGHQTYGDWGDVIVFRKPAALSDPTPVIHRAIMHITPDGSGAYDIPDLALFPTSDWDGVSRSGMPNDPYGLTEVTIRGMGWRHDLEVRFNLAAFNASALTRGLEGYITMGDNNAYNPFGSRYDESWIATQENIIGRARGEIPWFGLLKLMFDPSEDRQCCNGWGDPRAPRNSWDSLLIALPLVFGSPFIAEGVVAAWKRFVTPRLRRRHGEPETAGTDPPEESPTDDTPTDPR